MIGTTLGLNLAVIYSALFIFGIGYNSLVGYLETHKYHEGYVSDLVVIGVALTILPFITIAGMYPAWQVVGFVAGGFTASGIPMLIGSRVRHARMRKNEQRAARMAE